MKKLIFLFFLFATFISNAQESFFRGNNNYVVPVAPPIPTGTNPVTNGLILYLDATRPASYAGTGSTWSDLSTQNNTATLIGNPPYTYNPANFTFGPNVIATTTKSDVALSAATYIAWVNPSKTQGEYTGVIYSRNGYGGGTGPATGMALYRNNSVGYTWDNVPATYNWNSNLFVPNLGWSMIAITVSATTVTAYLCNASGIATASNSLTHAPLSGLNFFIACDPFNRSLRAFTGKIGTAMVYSTALSAADITSIYNAQKVAFGL